MTERNPLLPDPDGHYAPEALSLDLAQLRATPLGHHPLDPTALELATTETRRRFLSHAARGLGALALASLRQPPLGVARASSAVLTPEGS
jgi:hypothetical protein